MTCGPRTGSWHMQHTFSMICMHIHMTCLIHRCQISCIVIYDIPMTYDPRTGSWSMSHLMHRRHRYVIYNIPMTYDPRTGSWSMSHLMHRHRYDTIHSYTPMRTLVRGRCGIHTHTHTHTHTHINTCVAVSSGTHARMRHDSCTYAT